MGSPSPHVLLFFFPQHHPFSSCVSFGRRLLWSHSPRVHGNRGRNQIPAQHLNNTPWNKGSSGSLFQSMMTVPLKQASPGLFLSHSCSLLGERTTGNRVGRGSQSVGCVLQAWACQQMLSTLWGRSGSEKAILSWSISIHPHSAYPAHLPPFPWQEVLGTVAGAWLCQLATAEVGTGDWIVAVWSVRPYPPNFCMTVRVSERTEGLGTGRLDTL